MTARRTVVAGGAGLAVLALIVAFAMRSAPAGNAETDRIASTVSMAIGSSRPRSADDLVRAAASTAAVQDSSLRVVRAADLHGAGLSAARARLVLRIHLDATASGFSSVGAITACYEARFSFYGAIGTTRRIDCPAAATAIVAPPLPRSRRAALPAGFDRTLEQLLARLPSRLSARGVRRLVLRALPPAAVDPRSGLRDLVPTVSVRRSGENVGVALWNPDVRACLLGARHGRDVTVGRPSRVQLQPGELSCDAATALRIGDIAPPH